MSKFSAFPWFSDIPVPGDVYRYVIASDDTMVARVWVGRGGTSEADLRLLVRAPELLKIADRFFAFYELHKSARGGALGREYEELRAKIMGEVKA